MSKYPEVVKALCAALESEEGRIPWMYLDTSGIVTAGDGHALFTGEDAVALPWASRYPAELVRAEWAKVKAAERGNFAAKHYAGLTTCRLTNDEITTVLVGDVAKFAEEVEHAYPEFPAFPAGPQQAVLDMGFNLGVAGVRKKFPTCHGCILRRDWTAAANSCKRRPPISDERNNRTRTLFLQGLGA